MKFMPFKRSEHLEEFLASHNLLGKTMDYDKEFINRQDLIDDENLLTMYASYRKKLLKKKDELDKKIQILDEILEHSTEERLDESPDLAE